MKANEVLTKYKNGERDFRRLNLKGQSFQGKDLSGADFSEADIRGANFKNTNLSGTNFCKTKAGLQKRWVFVLLLVSWITSGLSGLVCLFAGVLVGLIVESNDVAEQVVGWIALVVIIVLFAVILRQGIGGAFAVAVAVAFAVGVTVARARAGVGSVAGAGFVAGAGAFAVAAAFTVAFAGAVAVAGPVAVSVAVSVAGAFAVAGALALDLKGLPAVAVAGAFAGALLGAYLGWRALKGDPRDAWIRTIAIAFAATGGTSFHKADLTDADFTGATLKSTDLIDA
ncbi:MAG: hypothetical protein F6K56_35185, partial [Moorea sp. SIO3G5]|nr:hypothetical protein [Moorena sp. SIO3G5]